VNAAGHRLPRAARIILWIALVLVVLAVLIRLVLDPIAAHYTQKALDGMPDYRGQFESVHVTMFPPGYAIHKLKLSEELRDGPAHEPFLYADHAHVGLSGSELLHGRLVARLRIDEPKITVIQRVPAREEKKPPTKQPHPAEQLRKMPKLRVERIEIRDGELAYKDLTTKNHPQIWVHRLEVAVENFATRPELGSGRPITVDGHGVLGKSGDLTLFVSADPWTEGLTFAGRVALKGFRTAELYDFIEPKTNLHAPEGSIDLFVEFQAKNGAITGGVRPVLKNVKIKPEDDGLGDRLKAWAADKALNLFSDRVPDRNAVATTIPIKGRVTEPQAQLFPTVMGIIRNAFVEGVTSGFARLPPAEAPKKEGVIEQIKHAVTKKAGPPQAQPAAEAKK
jgi:hypothetical protein